MFAVTGKSPGSIGVVFQGLTITGGNVGGDGGGIRMDKANVLLRDCAVSVNHAKWLEYYERLIQPAAPFPPEPATVEPCASRTPVPSDVPDPKVLSHGPTVALTGYLPDMRLTVRQWGG